MTLLTAYFLLIAALVVGSFALRRRVDGQQARRRAQRDRKAEVERRARRTL